MLNIDIKTIPHNRQRYPTCGDYWRDKHKVHFRISDMKDKDYEFLIAIHELIEHHLCEQRGIDLYSIDEFDKKYEKDRKKGDVSEPGNDPKAPYYLEHQFATKIEKLIAKELGVIWDEYDKAVNEL